MPNRKQARRARDLKLKLGLICLSAVVIIAAIIVIISMSGRNSDAVKTPEATATVTPEPEPTEDPASEPTAEPTAEPDKPTAAAESGAAQGKWNVVSPTPIAEGFLPIYSHAETNDMIMAITVDDFFQFKNARTIIDTAVSVGAKLTLFPIGKNVMRKELYETLNYAHDVGMEIENHTYSHTGLYRLDDDKMTKQVYYQSLAVNKVLGVTYQEHFFRPMGGDGRDDQRTHQYLKQLGFKGVAHWNVSGSGTDLNKLLKTMKPGNIYLFHTTNKDTAKLVEFIPACIEAGYTLVTLNEMFGFPENEVSEAGELDKDNIPKLEDYTLVPRTYKKTCYQWQVNLIQQRLVELGYSSDEPDGIYGSGTEKAIAEFQQNNGLEVTGNATPRTQDALFSDSAKAK